MTDRYPNASDEPLDFIRVNECEPSRGCDIHLRTKRFQALWNEIEKIAEENERLRGDLVAADRISRARVSLIEDLKLNFGHAAPKALRAEIERLKRGSTAFGGGT